MWPGGPTKCRRTPALSSTKRIGRNRFIAPLAAHHLPDVADERPGVAVATEKTLDRLWVNGAIKRLRPTF